MKAREQSEHSNGFFAKLEILNINWSKTIMRGTIDQSYAGRRHVITARPIRYRPALAKVLKRAASHLAFYIDNHILYRLCLCSCCSSRLRIGREKLVRSRGFPPKTGERLSLCRCRCGRSTLYQSIVGYIENICW